LFVRALCSGDNNMWLTGRNIHIHDDHRLVGLVATASPTETRLLVAGRLLCAQSPARSSPKWPRVSEQVGRVAAYIFFSNNFVFPRFPFGLHCFEAALYWQCR
jgi:hypothetical protein